MRPSLLALSIIAADFSNLSQELERVNTSGADFVHIDMMDGCFVPNISLGFPALKAIARMSKLPLDVHLMLQNPEPYLEKCKACGAHTISVHIECCKHPFRVMEKIRALGCRVGMALNPHTPIAVLEELAPWLDLVLLMAVEPGYCGQQLLPHSFRRVEKTKALLQAIDAQAQIEIDGGVNAENADRLRRAGADRLVSGAAFFQAQDQVSMVKQLKGTKETV